MFTRNKFVTNSSSSSFYFYSIWEQDEKFFTAESLAEMDFCERMHHDEFDVEDFLKKNATKVDRETLKERLSKEVDSLNFWIKDNRWYMVKNVGERVVVYAMMIDHITHNGVVFQVEAEDKGGGVEEDIEMNARRKGGAVGVGYMTISHH